MFCFIFSAIFFFYRLDLISNTTQKTIFVACHYLTFSPNYKVLKIWRAPIVYKFMLGMCDLLEKKIDFKNWNRIKKSQTKRNDSLNIDPKEIAYKKFKNNMHCKCWGDNQFYLFVRSGLQ